MKSREARACFLAKQHNLTKIKNEGVKKLSSRRNVTLQLHIRSLKIRVIVNYVQPLNDVPTNGLHFLQTLDEVELNAYVNTTSSFLDVSSTPEFIELRVVMD